MKRALDHQEENEADKLNIRVRAQDGQVMFYNIGKNTPIMKLLQHHCKRADIIFRTVQFLINGERLIDHKKTPEELKLKNGSVIDALLHMNGGGGPLFN